VNDDPTKPDLSFVQTSDLIDAILIIRELRPDGIKTQTYTDYDGGLSVCLGLATRAQSQLLKQVNKDSTED
jgi:mevalonate pyrophosphate decarboxylase